MGRGRSGYAAKHASRGPHCYDSIVRCTAWRSRGCAADGVVGSVCSLAKGSKLNVLPINLPDVHTTTLVFKNAVPGGTYLKLFHDDLTRSSIAVSMVSAAAKSTPGPG